MQADAILEVTFAGTTAMQEGLLDPSEKTAIRLVNGQRTADEIQRTERIMKLPPATVTKLFQRGFVAVKPAFINKTVLTIEAIEPAVQSAERQASYVKPIDELRDICQRAAELTGVRKIRFDLRIAMAGDIASYQELATDIADVLEKKHGYEVSRRFLRKVEGVVG